MYSIIHTSTAGVSAIRKQSQIYFHDHLCHHEFIPPVDAFWWVPHVQMISMYNIIIRASDTFTNVTHNPANRRVFAISLRFQQFGRNVQHISRSPRKCVVRSQRRFWVARGCSLFVLVFRLYCSVGQMCLDRLEAARLVLDHVAV
jgi:hypothetical protein